MVMNVSDGTTTSSGGTTNWRVARDRGRTEFERGEYQAALASFRSALLVNSNAGAQDKQVLLSNVVACRLKLGGAAQARAAVTDAKACVALNPSWSKAHVRLAAAYIAIGNNHSNDACNALQTAIRLDPNNRIAKQMLVQELRRDHRQAAASSAASNDNDDEDDNEGLLDDRDPPQNPGYVGPSSSPPENNSTTRPDDVPPPVRTTDGGGNDDLLDDDDGYDPEVSLTDRIQFYARRAYHHWYRAQSDDVRTAIHIVLAVLVLYVAFGGRFGLFDDSNSNSKLKGHYGAGNVYDQYHHQQQHNHRETARNNGYSSSSYANTDSSSSSYYDNNGGSSSYGGGGGGYFSSTSYGDNSSGLLYLALIGAGMYAAHVMGMSPWQAMLLMNMAGRRRHRRYNGFGGGGMMGGPPRYGRGAGFRRRRF